MKTEVSVETVKLPSESKYYRYRCAIKVMLGGRLLACKIVRGYRTPKKALKEFLANPESFSLVA